MAEAAEGAGRLHGAAAARALRATQTRRLAGPLTEAERGQALAFIGAVAAA
jgi:hypothetical protein